MNEKPSIIQRIGGWLFLFLLLLVVIIFWVGQPLINIFVLHIWTMLVFIQTQFFIKIEISKFWKRVMFFLQIIFIIVLTYYLNYELSLFILASFLLIAKLSNLLVYESLQTYVYLLQEDYFDVKYWWGKNKSIRIWNRVFATLIKKRFLKSITQIILRFLKSYDYPLLQKRYALLILKYWVELRRYQILPKDLVLHYTQKVNKLRPTHPRRINYLLGTACNFDIMRLWIVESLEQQAYQQLLSDFVECLSKDLEHYIQQPSSLNVLKKQDDTFIQNLDNFINSTTKLIIDDTLREKFDYCFGLFYITNGIAKNL